MREIALVALCLFIVAPALARPLVDDALVHDINSRNTSWTASYNPRLRWHQMSLEEAKGLNPRQTPGSNPFFDPSPLSAPHISFVCR